MHLRRRCAYEAYGTGGTPIRNEGGSYFLYSYSTVEDDVDAIVAYLHRPIYAGILAG